MTSLSCGMVSGPKMLSGGWSNVTRQYAGDRRVRRTWLAVTVGVTVLSLH